MGDASHKNGNFEGTGVIVFTGKIMLVAILVLLFVVIFLFYLHLFWYRRQENNTTRRRRRLEFAAVVPASGRGLDPALLKAIPIIVFDPKDAVECAVCLCEVSECEKIRVLPKCNHGFHVDCIDMWFESHSTCPLCRNPVANDEAPMVVANFPTNVLIWGNESQVSTFGPCVEEEGNADAETSTSSQISEEEEQKSWRLRSLKRLLTGSTRVDPCTHLEQGLGGQT